jgi:hypothetical protein
MRSHINFDASSAARHMRGRFVDVLEDLTNREKSLVILSHLGILNQDLAHDFADGVEIQLKSHGEDRQIVKRIFTIVVEGCQNIRIHGERDEEGAQLTMLFLARTKTVYRLVFGNLMKNRDADVLLEYIHRLNDYDNRKLERLYAKVIHRSFLSIKDGPGLGLLLMRMRSHNVLDARIEPLSEQVSLFSVQTVINR